MFKISTSILSSDDRINCVKKLNNTATDYIHIDAMDNIFVPNYQMPVEEVNELGKYTQKPFDIHLMVTDPETYIDNLNITNIKAITFHLEIDKDINYLINKIKSLNYEVGLAIKPNTNLNSIDKYLYKIDKVIIMSVEPGFGGQKFLEKTVKRIKSMRNKRKDLIIEVDGGITDENINKIKNNIDIAVIGSYITKSNNYEETISNIKK